VPVEPRYVGVPAMNALARDLGEPLAVETGTRLLALRPAAGGWRAALAGREEPLDYQRVALAVPAPEAVPLLESCPRLAAAVAPIALDPCWAVLAGFPAPLPLPFDAALVADSPLAWVARNGSKPARRGAESWVLHATPAWSAAQLGDPAGTVAAELLAAFSRALGHRLPAPAHLDAHRWRYARTREPLGEPCLYDAEARLGVCGDWCLGARVESALLSGTALAERLLGTA
jgi:renalase